MITVSDAKFHHLFGNDSVTSHEAYAVTNRLTSNTKYLLKWENQYCHLLSKSNSRKSRIPSALQHWLRSLEWWLSSQQSVGVTVISRASSRRQ